MHGQVSNMVSSASIARRHFNAAMSEATHEGFDPDTLARFILGLVVAKYLETRTVDDVRAELNFVAETCDPNTEFAFLRP